MRNDAPVTAILNLNFRPQTPEKKRDDLGAVGDQIDLLIEEATRQDEQSDAAVAKQHDAQAAQAPAAKNDRAPSPAQTR